jgi:iron complex transport system substrate-binding protein
MLAIVLIAFASTASDARPKRIVSLNLCADQYLIALADPNQIAALTQYSRDPAMSYYAERARSLPISTRSAEEVLMLRPDLVVGVPYRQREALAPLKARGVPIIDLPKKDGIAGIEETIQLVAAAIGYPERGRALIVSIRARLTEVGPPPGRGRVAAYYQRRGYLTGAGTLVDEMMRRVGLVNLAAKLDLKTLSRLSIEQMAMARPDFLILESASTRTIDRGTEMLNHPLLNRAVPPDRRLVLPQALTVCGGPAYPEAVEMLATQVRAADRVTRSGGRTSR